MHFSKGRIANTILVAVVGPVMLSLDVLGLIIMTVSSVWRTQALALMGHAYVTLAGKVTSAIYT